MKTVFLIYALNVKVKNKSFKKKGGKSGCTFFMYVLFIFHLFACVRTRFLMHRLPFLSLCLLPYKSARCTSSLCFSLSHWDFTPTCWGGGGAFSLLRQTPGVTRIVFQAITSKAEPWEGNERREVREWEREGQRNLNPSPRRLLVNSPPPHGIIESDGACTQPTTPCSGSELSPL